MYFKHIISNQRYMSSFILAPLYFIYWTGHKIRVHLIYTQTHYKHHMKPYVHKLPQLPDWWILVGLVAASSVFWPLQRAGRSGQNGPSVMCLGSRSASASAFFCSPWAASVPETPRRAGPVFLIPISSRVRGEMLISANKIISDILRDNDS